MQAWLLCALLRKVTRLPANVPPVVTQADIAAAVARITALVNEPQQQLADELRDALARQRPGAPAPAPAAASAAAPAGERKNSVPRLLGPRAGPPESLADISSLIYPADEAAVAAARDRLLAQQAELPHLLNRLGATSEKLKRVLSAVDAERARPAPGSVERAVAGVLPMSAAEQSPLGLSPAAGAGAAETAAHRAQLLAQPAAPF